MTNTLSTCTRAMAVFEQAMDQLTLLSREEASDDLFEIIGNLSVIGEIMEELSNNPTDTQVEDTHGLLTEAETFIALVHAHLKATA